MNFRRYLPAALLAMFLAPRILFAQDKTITYNFDPASNPPDLIVSLRHVKADISFVPAEHILRHGHLQK